MRALSLTAATRSSLSVLHIALAASVLLHAVALSIKFTFPEAFQLKTPPSLEVVLVNSKTATRPEKPDVLAQANLDGGGNTDQDRRAKSPMPVLPQVRPGNDALEQAQRRVKRLEQEQRALLAQAAKKSATVVTQPETVLDPTPPTPQPPAPDLPSGQELVARTMAMARLEAQIARQTEEYNKRPRKQFVGARAAEVRFAQYVEDWRQKVERIGNMNYPADARGRIYGSLQMTVQIRADGSLAADPEITRPSGYQVLDRAARRIVNMGAPYAPFPADIRRDTDILVITRTWIFAPGDRLHSE